MMIWLLFGMMLAIMLLRVFLPLGQPTPGAPQHVIALRFRERLRLQRFNVYAIGAVMVLMAVTGNSSLALQLVVITGVMAILFLPVRYCLTDEGIGLNNVVFRRWSEFRGLQTGERSFQLVGGDGVASFTIHTAPSLHPELGTALQRLLRRRGTEAAAHRTRRSS